MSNCQTSCYSCCSRSAPTLHQCAGQCTFSNNVLRCFLVARSHHIIGYLRIWTLLCPHTQDQTDRSVWQDHINAFIPISVCDMSRRRRRSAERSCTKQLRNLHNSREVHGVMSIVTTAVVAVAAAGAAAAAIRIKLVHNDQRYNTRQTSLNRRTVRWLSSSSSSSSSTRLVNWISSKGIRKRGEQKVARWAGDYNDVQHVRFDGILS